MSCTSYHSKASPPPTFSRVRVAFSFFKHDLQDETERNHNAGQGLEELATGKQENKRKHSASLQSMGTHRQLYRVDLSWLQLSPDLEEKSWLQLSPNLEQWAEPAPKRIRETKKEYLSDILFDLWKDGLMAGKTSLAEIPFPERFKKKNKKKAYFKSLMELCDRVLLKDDKIFLFTSRDIKFGHSNVKHKTDRIQARAFEMMKQLDNQTAEQLQPTYALGKRYYEWSETMTIYKSARSVAKSEAPGNTNVGLQLPQLTFFGCHDRYVCREGS